MEAIKIRRKIRSKNIHIKELENFISQEAEIIILPVEDRKKSSVSEILKLASSIKTGVNLILSKNDYGESGKIGYEGFIRY